MESALATALIFGKPTPGPVCAGFEAQKTRKGRGCDTEPDRRSPLGRVEGTGTGRGETESPPLGVDGTRNRVRAERTLISTARLNRSV